MKNLLSIMSLIFLVGCVSNPNLVSSGSVKLDPEKIVEEWTFVGEQCAGQVRPNECPEQMIHVHQKAHRNPKPNVKPEMVFLSFEVSTNGDYKIIAIGWDEGSTR